MAHYISSLEYSNRGILKEALGSFKTSKMSLNVCSGMSISYLHLHEILTE